MAHDDAGVLVVGGQSLCLLLTLLAVPVFYSIFDDLQTLTLSARLKRIWHSLTGAVTRPLTVLRPTPGGKPDPNRARTLAKDAVD